MSTSPGADSTPVERRTLVERLRHIVGVERHAETLGCPMILLPASADAVEAAAAELEALLAALLRSQQERDEAERLLSLAPEVDAVSVWPAEAQRLWEACIGLAEKADFKAFFAHVRRCEDRAKAAEQLASEWEAACGRAQEHADHWTAEAARFASDLAAAEAQRDALQREVWSLEGKLSAEQTVAAGYRLERNEARAERDALATALRETLAFFGDLGDWETAEGEDFMPTLDRARRTLHPHPETPSHE